MSPLPKRRKCLDMTPIQIDGSMLEGGGQILRNASSLSAITGKPITVTDIRAKRTKPGLRPQHLTGLQLIETLSAGALTGGTVGSTEITLQPGPLQCQEGLEANTQTAGSCVLLAQSAVPCLLFAAASSDITSNNEKTASSDLVLKGGTDASMAPPVGYMHDVLIPTLAAQLGIDIGLDVERRGFFPKGGGIVKLSVKALEPGTSLPPISLTQRGYINTIRIKAFTAGRVASHVGERMVKSALASITSCLEKLKSEQDRNATIEVENTHEPVDKAFGDGCGIVIVAETSTGCLLGGSGLGERGVTAETVGERAASELTSVVNSGACVDEWLQDQLIIFMALAKGRSEILTGEPTLHTRTAIAVAELLLPSCRFEISQLKDSENLWRIVCEGSGFVAGEDGSGS